MTHNQKNDNSRRCCYLKLIIFLYFFSYLHLPSSIFTTIKKFIYFIFFSFSISNTSIYLFYKQFHLRNFFIFFCFSTHEKKIENFKLLFCVILIIFDFLHFRILSQIIKVDADTLMNNFITILLRFSATFEPKKCLNKKKT